ncbi:hypothetical protein VSU16_04715 [Cetobacterium somerae]|uniref:hypothetical protein n=1 Tax=Cetobacterium somerae TaxID=188913 RepID=UPI002E7B7102|nr:hypothetical protein [Cetobacterium somerae]WVJ02046.1 hypothetical protein VSU16_04715 [Cetobacterium somerae]
MIKKVFQAGDYGKKGKYTLSDLQSWADKEFSVPILAGHLQDYKTSGYPMTAIPKAGEAKVVGVDEEGYLLADVVYNEFGKSLTNSGAYSDFSLGIDILKNPNHLALLGYMPPHIETLDSAFSEFSKFEDGELQYIEFNQGGNMTLEELLAALEGLSSQEKLTLVLAALNGIDVTQVSDLQQLLNKVWELDDQKWYVNKLVAEGYVVEKTAEFNKDKIALLADPLGFILTEKPKPVTMTQDEWKAQYAAEFARTQELDGCKEKFINLFPPTMKQFAEFCVIQAFEEKNYGNIIEFSAENKKSMAEFIKESITTGGPFAHLMQEFSKGQVEIKDEIDPFEAGKKAAGL